MGHLAVYFSERAAKLEIEERVKPKIPLDQSTLEEFMAPK